jgi:hypothetical protein
MSNLNAIGLAALLLGVPAGSANAQRPAPATAQIAVSARVVPITTALQSARLVRQTLSASLSSGRATSRSSILWVSVERPRKRARRVTVNYLAN